MHLRNFLLCACLGAVVAAQPAPEAAVHVAGAVKQPLQMTAETLRAMPRWTVKTSRQGGAATVYEGVRLHEVLKAAGAVNGAQLRGQALASYVLAEGGDGYQALFSLAELDPAFTDSDVLLADTVDGKALGGAQGRFRLVAPQDRLGARWVRGLVKITVVSLRR